MNLEVVFAGDHVRLAEPVLASADLAPGSVIPATAIRDADPDAVPPEIRTVSGRTVFVSAVQRAELERFCLANRIRLQSRPNVWGDLLEPFLDTEFTPERRTVTQARLSQVGLDEDAVAGIRAKVAPLMVAYNAMHWDWCDLGLADLMDAATAPWIPEDRQIKPAERSAFCTWAMKIADLGHSHDRP